MDLSVGPSSRLPQMVRDAMSSSLSLIKGTMMKNKMTIFSSSKALQNRWYPSSDRHFLSNILSVLLLFSLNLHERFSIPLYLSNWLLPLSKFLSVLFSVNTYSYPLSKMELSMKSKITTLSLAIYLILNERKIQKTKINLFQ